MSDKDTFNLKGLEQLYNALHKAGDPSRAPKCRVGILGDKDARDGKGNSNATIGAAHEYGTSTLPQRSFLRVPIADHLNDKMKESKALTKKTMEKVIKSGTVVPWLKAIGGLAEGIVAEAFATGGFGKWAPWKNPNYKNNANQILVDSQQLRNSITSDVVGK